MLAAILNGWEDRSTAPLALGKTVESGRGVKGHERQIADSWGNITMARHAWPELYGGAMLHFKSIRT